MDRITLLDLIESETYKLSPRGRELWEELEILVELSVDEQDITDSLADINQRMAADLPPLEYHTLDRLTKLHDGLYESDRREERGESGEQYRDQSVILAASLKDRVEGRQTDPDMTVDEAVARLRQ